ncbi:MAG: SBBP repeat-containing protein [Blastocatellia bacterium]
MKRQNCFHQMWDKFATHKMWSVLAITVIATLVWMLSLAGRPFQTPLPTTPGASRNLNQVSQVKITETYGQLPLSFEANKGQTDSQVKFLSRGSGYGLFLTPTEAVLALRKPTAPKKQPQMDFESKFAAPERFHQLDFKLDFRPAIKSAIAETAESEAIEQAVLRMQLVSANAAPRMVGEEERLGKANYFLGNDPTQWRTNVPSYAKVRYEAVYPGVDLVYYGNQRQLEYDFIVAPGVDPAVIRLGFTGAEKLEVGADGELAVDIAGEQVRMHKPLIYQERGGQREEISGGYVLLSSAAGEGAGLPRVGFRLGRYDTSRPLVIDPVLVYSTYLGGSHQDSGRDITADANGNAYITGDTLSTNFPTHNALQPTKGGGFSITEDVFVTKLNAAGNLVYSTYLGGSGIDHGLGIAVDANGNTYVTGWTHSTDFPTANPLQPTSGGNGDVFLTKLNAAGSALVYSTYLGGSGFDGAISFNKNTNDIYVDASGSAYVTGTTSSTDFPTQNAMQPTSGGSFDAFVTKLNAAGSALVYSTYLGGNGTEGGFAIVVDASGSAYIAGGTTSTNFPTASPLQAAHSGGAVWEGFVTKLNATGSALVYSTYLGSTSQDLGYGIAVDASGNAYITGETSSFNFAHFPTVNPLQPTIGGGFDAFVTKVNAAGSALLYSTYLGGSGSEIGFGITVDTNGNAYVTGWTTSTDFPTASPVQPTSGGASDAFVTKVNAAGSALIYSTYLGGSSDDRPLNLAVDANGNAYVTGFTRSTNFPTVNAAQSTFGGGFNDAFLVKIKDNQPPTVDAGRPYDVNEGVSVTVTATGSDPEGGALTYAWDLDNNGTFEIVGQSVTFSATSLDGPSSHPIKVQVTDNGGLTATDTATVNVLNVAPTASFANLSGAIIRGQSATLAFSNQFDPSAADTAAGFRYSYDCTNDGTFEVSDTSAVSHACAYPVSGTFTARGRIKDKDGGYTDYTVQVIVLTPQQAISNLIDLVKSFHLQPQGIENSLIVKLQHALDSLAAGNIANACDQLTAFINEVNAQAGKKLTTDQANQLITGANQVKMALGCP